MIEPRRRRRIEIILLAAAIVVGILASVDGSSRELWSLDEHIRDFWFLAHSGQVAEVVDALRAVPDVTEVSGYRYLPLSWLESDAYVGSSAIDGSVVGIDPAHPPAEMRGVPLVGSLELPRGAIGMSRAIAERLSVGLADPVYFRHDYLDPATNLTLSRRLTFTVTAIYGEPGSDYGHEVFHIRDWDWAATQLGIAAPENVTLGDVWVDRDKLFRPYDIAAALSTVNALEGQLDRALAPFAGDATDYYLTSHFKYEVADILTFLWAGHIALAVIAVLAIVRLGWGSSPESSQP